MFSVDLENFSPVERDEIRGTGKTTGWNINLYLYVAKAKLFSVFCLKIFVRVTQVGVFVRENCRPGYRDLGNRASSASHTNTSNFFIRLKERTARRDLGNRASPVDLNHMKKLLKCPNFKFRISFYMIIIFCIASPKAQFRRRASAVPN